MTALLPANTRRVIVERTHGWEGASAGLLARVFDTTPQHIASIAKDRCASCGATICGCTDAAWSRPTAEVSA